MSISDAAWLQGIGRNAPTGPTDGPPYWHENLPVLRQAWVAARVELV